MAQPNRMSEPFYTLSISVKKELFLRIEKARNAENKNRSEFCREILEDALKEKEAGW